jgi:hypothetical protein
MDDIFELLMKKGYAHSARFFSTHYCLRAPNYLAMSGVVSDATGLTVVRQLAAEGRWLTALRVLHMIVVGRRQHDDEVAA